MKRLSAPVIAAAADGQGLDLAVRGTVEGAGGQISLIIGADGRAEDAEAFAGGGVP